jgi:NADH:ubiquinone oxidoreductase subunit E
LKAGLIELDDMARIKGQIKEIVTKSRGQAGALIRVLQQTQGLVGYLPKPVIQVISREMKIPLSEVYGIISFYHFFTMQPKGRHVIQVCMGTSCYVKGGQKLIDSLKKEYDLSPDGITADGKFSLEIVRCLGACGLSPVMAVDKDIHARVKASRVGEILSTYD